MRLREVIRQGSDRLRSWTIRYSTPRHCRGIWRGVRRGTARSSDAPLIGVREEARDKEEDAEGEHRWEDAIPCEILYPRKIPAYGVIIVSLCEAGGRPIAGLQECDTRTRRLGPLRTCDHETDRADKCLQPCSSCPGSIIAVIISRLIDAGGGYIRRAQVFPNGIASCPTTNENTSISSAKCPRNGSTGIHPSRSRSAVFHFHDPSISSRFHRSARSVRSRAKPAS